MLAQTATKSPLSVTIRLALHGSPLLLALHAGSALAQQSSATTLDRIEVTENRDNYQAGRVRSATKTDTPLRDVPQAVTVVTEGLIRDQAMQSMADVVRYVPGVQMAQGEGHRDAPILRGNTSTADFFVNGMRDDVQYFRDLYNVERVEVLKGPSGMIFGRGASGGLINRVTKQADWSNPRGINVTLGSWDNRRLIADYGQAWSDAGAFRVTGLYEDSDSYRDGVNLKRWAVNPTVTLRPSEATTLTFGYEHFKDDRVSDRGIPSLLPVSGRAIQVDESQFFGSATLSPAWAEIDAVTAQITHQFSDSAKITNQTRLADYDKFYQNVFPGAYTASNERVSISAYNNLTNRKNLLNQTDLTLDFQTGAVRHVLLAGVELGRQETDNFRQTGYFPSVSPTATSDFVTLADSIYTKPVVFRQAAGDADNHSVAKNAALYVQDQISLSENWQLLAGVRYDYFNAELRNNRNGQKVSSTDSLLSPRAGAIYKPREDMSFYASYSISYVPRAGEQLASLTASNRALDPEKFTNIEVGYKWDVNDRLSFTSAIYQLDRTNVAITDPNNPAQSLLVDGQRVKGVELGLSGNITDAWQVMAGYAYQDSEVQQPGTQNGNELGQVPKHSVSLWNRYDLSERWGVGLGATYRDSVYVASDNAVTLPSFVRLDAAAYLKVSDSVRLQLNIENLFDRQYFASAHSNNNILPGSPRAFRLGLDWRF